MAKALFFWISIALVSHLENSRTYIIIFVGDVLGYLISSIVRGLTNIVQERSVGNNLQRFRYRVSLTYPCIYAAGTRNTSLRNYAQRTTSPPVIDSRAWLDTSVAMSYAIWSDVSQVIQFNRALKLLRIAMHEHIRQYCTPNRSERIKRNVRDQLPHTINLRHDLCTLHIDSPLHS